MQLHQLIKAYSHIDELFRLVLPYQTTRSLLCLKKQLKEEVDTALAMQSALIEKHAGIQNEDGSYRFPSIKDQKAFMADYDALMNQDQTIHLSCVDLTRFTDVIRISPAAMEALDGIVLFEAADAECKAGGCQ